MQTPSLREIRNFFLIQLFRSGVLERKMRGGEFRSMLVFDNVNRIGIGEVIEIASIFEYSN